MGKSLIIAEKPNVATDIAEALGGFNKENGYYERHDTIVSAARGHLIELNVPEAEGAEAWQLAALPIIPRVFNLEVAQGCSTEFQRLKKLMWRDDVDEIINACDAGREGELIFRLIYRKAGSRKPMKRMWIQSMTAAAIRKAHKELRPGSEFDNLADSAISRAESDWIVGINVTRAVTRMRLKLVGINEVSTVGRVQTPTLAMPVLRERKIASFCSKPYWEIYGNFRTSCGDYRAKWVPSNNNHADDGARVFDKNTADELIKKCQGQDPTLVSDEFSSVNTQPPLLFDITSLQKEANNKFKFSAKKTLDIAQFLYDKSKSITYPRTEARVLPEDYLEAVSETLASFHGTHLAELAQCVLENNWVTPVKHIFNDAEITDHFAIVPTGQQQKELSEDQKKIYDLIARRFIGVFYPPAIHNKTERTTIVNGETFKTTGKILIEPGWLVTQIQTDKEKKTDQEEPALCKFEDGENVANVHLELKEFKTKPPKRYTEATLLAAMEHAGRLVEDKEIQAVMKTTGTGLGRPAIRDSIIEGLANDRDGKNRPKVPYILRQESELVPTPKAMELISFFEDSDINLLVSPEMTGQWEQKLILMEKGEYSRPLFMKEISEITTSIVNTIKSNAESIPDASIVCFTEPCPKCSSVINCAGPRFECSSPTCDFNIWDTVAGRKLSKDEVGTLLRQGKTALLKGFKSKAGKLFSAALQLNRESWKLDFIFDESAPKQMNVTCPRCNSAIVSDDRAYTCNGCELKIWINIAQKKITIKDLQALLKEGKTPLLTGFKSKTGKPFSAMLTLNIETGQVEFEFQERK